MNDNSFLKEIGRSFIVSSFIPSALFVSLAVVLYRGFIPGELLQQISRNKLVSGREWLPVVVLVTWVAFFLFSSIDWTIKLYEGYYTPSFLRKIITWAIKFFWHSRQVQNYQEIEKIRSKKKKTQRDHKRYSKIKGIALGELQTLEMEAPVNSDYLLPTRLGNILRACEIYAAERYSIEGITLWPRLFAILPRQFVKDLEEKTNHFIFLLNSSFLIYINAGICFLLGCVGIVNTFWPNLYFFKLLSKNNVFANGFRFVSPFELILIGSALVCFGYILYSISVNAAHDYSYFVRTGFDLYRMDLLKQLHQNLPKNQEEERQIWSSLSEYLIASNRLGMENFNLPYFYYAGENEIDKEKSASAVVEAEESQEL